jgi:hypothetical protein
MTVRERNYEAIRSRVRKPIYAVGAEIVILPLFAVGNNRRACGFKPFNGVSNRTFIESIEARILAVALYDFFDQIEGPRDAADWLGGYRDWCGPGHICCFARSIIDLTVFGSIKGFRVFVATRRKFFSRR